VPEHRLVRLQVDQPPRAAAAPGGYLSLIGFLRSVPAGTTRFVRRTAIIVTETARLDVAPTFCQNRVYVAGRIVCDPWRSNASANHDGLTLRIAIDDGSPASTAASEVNLVVSGKLAEYVAHAARTGEHVIAAGRLHTRSWEPIASPRLYITEVIADYVRVDGHPGPVYPTKSRAGSTLLPVSDDISRFHTTARRRAVPKCAGPGAVS
jgi:hypothetical protein